MIRAALILGFVLTAQAASAQLLADRLKAMSDSFDCKPVQGGDMCTTKGSGKKAGFNYSQPVVILIPKGVQRPNQLLMHMNGFRGVCEGNISAPKLAEDNKLLQQMVSSGAKNSVMVFPVSLGKETTYNSDLVPNFKQFTERAEELLSPTKKTWAISGHSGAYLPIQNILARQPNSVLKKINSVGLLDATYSGGTRGALERAARANPDMKVYSAYINGSPTAGNSRSILSSSAIQSKKGKALSGVSHCNVPRKYYGEFLSYAGGFNRSNNGEATTNSAPRTGQN